MGQEIKQIAADNGVTFNTYDLLGRLVATVSPESYVEGAQLSAMNRSEFAYDTMGRMVTMTQIYYDDSTSQWKSYVSKACKYDNRGNLIKELNALGYAAGTGATAGEKINSGYGVESTYNYANL